MNGEKTLGDLFREAAGDRDRLVIEGDEYALTVCGGVLVNGRDLSEMSAFTVERTVRLLREAAEDKYLDPATNPMIRLDPKT